MAQGEKDIRITGRLTIPADEVRFDFAHSGGPGGQHANKSSTQATLVFDVNASSALSEPQKRRLRRALKNRINREGELRLTSRDSRSQLTNRRRAVERFRELLAEALRPRPKRKRTRPTRASRERRLREKRQRAERKQERQRPDPPPRD
jgi:ribosome-associated protein